MALEPITRQEKIIAGQDLTPITRMEMFLKQFGGGGGGLPSGGAPYQQLVTDGTGNAKWEDRLAYETDPIIAEVFPEQTVAVSLNNSVYMASTSQKHDLVLGNQYTVKWDGTEYECVCSEFRGMTYIGNLSILAGIDDTGEPFFIFTSGTLFFSTANTSPEHTVSISTKSVEIKKIPDKFLEKDVFVVNATTTYPSTEIKSADKTYSEILSAARQNKRCTLIIDASGSTRIYEMRPLDDFIGNEKGPVICFRTFDFGSSETIASGFSASEYIITPENTWSCEDFTLNNPITSSEVQDITGVKTFFKDCLVINSSTSGSSKKFKITVDDSGTISATEVIA